jgi:multicomponent Na+:H+ antiporter subunit B
MRHPARLAVFGAGAAGLAFLLVWGMSGLAPFGEYPGPYGEVLNRVELAERHATNVVAAVVFDYRGFDTLGEELILFAAALGVAMLLRTVRQDDVEQTGDRVESDAVRLVGLAGVAVTLLLGLWVVAHGNLTPGGGFQGGVVLAAALVLIYLTIEYRAYREAAPKPLVDAGKGLGVGAYAALGIVSLVLGHAYLESFLGPGTAGTLRSGGSFMLLNWASGLAVAASFAMLFAEFLEEVEVMRGDKP